MQRALLLVLLLLAPAPARGDAIVWTQAMLATTIAEFYIEEGAIRVELEIGMQDVEAFANLLPDDVYEKLGVPPRPLAERLGDFFGRDFAIVPEGADPLPGRILEMGPRPRVKRDPITGEPLPLPEGEEPEVVVFARLEYPLPARPERIAFSSPPGASVGFVVYHEGVAVNDFRYLSRGQVLRLDWDDPWYSEFQGRGLRRQYYAPMSGFLYVEPYEVRKEIIARPLDLQGWIDLGLEGRETIPVEMQPDLLRKVAAFLREHHPVLIDGEVVVPELARINFLERSLRTSRVIDPPEELDVYSAQLGAIFVYPTDGLPQTVTMDWDLWSDRLTRVPASSVDQAGPLPTYLEPDWRVLEWKNFLKNPELPTLQMLRAPPTAVARALLWGRWLLAGLALVAAVQWARRRSGALAAATAAAVLLSAGAFWASREASLSDERAGAVVAGLLHNVYRAFDFRDEGQIYDVLARSASGDLLEQVYLETRRGLELQSQGGARAKVKEVELVELEAESAGGGAFTATATWNVAGSVGHWGHIHQRRNRYRAELQVAPVDGAWKLVGVEILEEQRI